MEKFSLGSPDITIINVIQSAYLKFQECLLLNFNKEEHKEHNSDINTLFENILEISKTENWVF